MERAHREVPAAREVVVDGQGVGLFERASEQVGRKVEAVVAEEIAEQERGRAREAVSGGGDERAARVVEAEPRVILGRTLGQQRVGEREGSAALDQRRPARQRARGVGERRPVGRITAPAPGRRLGARGQGGAQRVAPELPRDQRRRRRHAVPGARQGVGPHPGERAAHRVGRQGVRHGDLGLGQAEDRMRGLAPQPLDHFVERQRFLDRENVDAFVIVGGEDDAVVLVRPAEARDTPLDVGHLDDRAVAREIEVEVGRAAAVGDEGELVPGWRPGGRVVVTRGVQDLRHLPAREVEIKDAVAAPALLGPDRIEHDRSEAVRREGDALPVR